MLEYHLKIGLVPVRRWLADDATRKGIFQPSKAVENKELVVQYIKTHFSDDQTSFVDLEWLNEEGLLIEACECERVQTEFARQGVDAIFIINCNFGNEEAAGQIAKRMNLPTLLWGPQDTVFEEDGTRYTDCQCGLFAISKQLRRLGVPFSYIENCRLEDDCFKQGLLQFFSVACMVKNFKKLRLTQVGTRLNPFKSVMANELELTEKFGFNISTVNLAVMAEMLNKLYTEKDAQLEKDAEKIKSMYEVGQLDNETLKRMLTFVYAYLKIFEENKADVLLSECWTCMPQAFGANPCLAISILYDMGYIVTCESDMHGAVTQALLACATRGKERPLFGEFTVRHPENRNAELLWHCGPFPYSVKKEGVQARLFNTKPSFQAKDGIYTLARFQGDHGVYTLLGGKFHTTEGPHTFGTYLWAEFKDLSKLERKLIEGPYIHHMSEIYGDYTEVLREFCKYIPGLTFDPCENEGGASCS